MNLKKNIAANYASQIYVTIIGIVLVPFYIQYMGAESYGLVGFFAMLQAWFNLLDMGLTPTIARESARYHGGAMSALVYRRIYRALSLIFCTIALIAGGLLIILSGTIASRWLKVEELAHAEVTLAVQIMAISVALKWVSGLYRGVVSGSERLIWLSMFTSLIATLRFVGVFGSMWLWGYTPRVFFIHQLAISIFETTGLFITCNKIIPKLQCMDESIGWHFSSIKPILKFSLSIAFTSTVWIFATQTDKLILSGVLTLSEYGHFTLAVLVASGIIIISGPINNAIMPHMTRLYAEGNNTELINVYRKSIRLACVICGSATATVIYFPEALLYAWSGDDLLTEKSAAILRLYAIGNGLLSISAYPYYIQYARGNLRLHIIGNILMILVLVPFIIYASMHYGSVGAGYAWMLTNFIFATTWLNYVHKKILGQTYWFLILKDIFNILLPIFSFGFATAQLMPNLEGRVSNLIYLLLFGSICMLLAFLVKRLIDEKN